MSLITRVSLTAFSFEAENLAASAKGSSIGGLFYEKGARTEITKYAIRLETEDGCIGEYVPELGRLAFCFWPDANACTYAGRPPCRRTPGHL